MDKSFLCIDRQRQLINYFYLKKSGYKKSDL